MAKRTLRQNVYDAIIEDILSGMYSNDSILSESGLISKYGISKSPIREALIDLCNEGILKNIPRVGYMLIPYSGNYYKNILQFRNIIEPYYLDIYWDKLDDKKVTLLEVFNNRILAQSDLSNPIAYWRTNMAFHLKLASLFLDSFYYETLEKTLQRQTFVFAQNYWNQWDQDKYAISSESHASFLTNLKNGNKEKTILEFKSGIGNALDL